MCACRLGAACAGPVQVVRTAGCFTWNILRLMAVAADIWSRVSVFHVKQLPRQVGL